MGLFDDLLPPPTQRARSVRQVQRPDFARPKDWTPFTLGALPELSGIVALDTENKDPGLSSGSGSSWPHSGLGFNCGYAISSAQGDFYLPIRHADGNVDPDMVHRWLKAQAAKPDVTFVYANCQHDLGWLWREGIEPANDPVDVQGMAALLDEYRFSYSLDSLGRDFLGDGKSDDEFKQACAQGGLLDPKSNMDLVPGWIAEPYGVQDARLTRALYYHFAPLLAAEGLDRVHALERQCYLVGFDMKRHGVRVNTDKAVRHMERFERLRDERLAVVRDLTGISCSATDLQSLGRALLVENPGLDLPKTSSGLPSVRKEVLEGFSSPVADAINAARRYEKAINTFFRGYILGCAVRGRIHADFNPLRRSNEDEESGTKGTTTGRWSCTDPNLQNVPTRDSEIGPAVRECFEPEDGEQWGKLDFSAQEPRLGVHFAEKANLRGAREMGDRFRRNPRTDLHRETATNMRIERNPAKIINLAIWYGAGGAEIARRLGLPTEFKRLDNGDVIEVAGPEAARLIRQHHQSMPFIKKLQKETKAAADRRGWVKTIGGRRCRFQKRGDEYLRTYKACNSVIQGSAADQMKVAQVNMRRAGILPLIVVHDDCSISLPMGEEGERKIAQVKEIMETAVILTIPVLADVKIGRNWAEVRG